MNARIECRAKVNLFLEVTARRPDGYHDIESVFLEIPLADRLEAASLPEDAITLECDTPGVPLDGRNLVVKATRLLKNETGRRGGIAFKLEKHIPMGAGLGGGSSDAAGTLRLANNLLGTNLTAGDLLRLAAQLGSDVPFFLHGGACLCRGRGELITPLPQPPPLPLCLVLTDLHSNTAEAYRRLHLPGPGAARSAKPFITALATGDREAIRREAFNRFEESVFSALPDLARLHNWLEREKGVRVCMSGSGTAMWFVDEKVDGGNNDFFAGFKLKNKLRPRLVPCLYQMPGAFPTAKH